MECDVEHVLSAYLGMTAALANAAEQYSAHLSSGAKLGAAVPIPASDNGFVHVFSFVASHW